MKKKYIIVSIILLILFLTGCSNNKYDIAQELYRKGKYVPAVDYFDKFIFNEQRGSDVTEAELKRSDSYYQLGLKAYQLENWDLAIRLLYLANSTQADEIMDNCYYELAQIALSEHKTDKALENFQYILDNLQTSELIPDILFARMKIYLTKNKKFKAYDDFSTLAHKYPDNSILPKAQKLIDENMQYYIQDAKNYLKEEHFSTALDKLLALVNNPTKYIKEIKKEIAGLYINLADSQIKLAEYLDAKKYMEKALEWDSSLKSLVDGKLSRIVDLFIQKGDELMKEDRIDEAIRNYKEVFDIIPDYSPARNAIGKAIKLKEDYEEAERLKKNALQYEKDEQYESALNNYKISYNLHKIPEIKEKIVRMTNIVKAANDPIGFAKEIIFSYKNGAIKKFIKKFVKEKHDEYRGDANISGWKVQYSVGKYNYEVRYDILTPDDNYYYVWRVNLENRTVSPLNKITEKILEKR